MLISLAYRLTRKLLGAVATIALRDVATDVELLVLRPENTVLRRRVPRVRHEAEDRLWLAALSSLVPRRRWAEVFAVTAATPMAWYRGPLSAGGTGTAGIAHRFIPYPGAHAAPGRALMCAARRSVFRVWCSEAPYQMPGQEGSVPQTSVPSTYTVIFIESAKVDWAAKL